MQTLVNVLRIFVYFSGLYSIIPNSCMVLVIICPYLLLNWSSNVPGFILFYVDFCTYRQISIVNRHCRKKVHLCVICMHVLLW